MDTKNISDQLLSNESGNVTVVTAVIIPYVFCIFCGVLSVLIMGGNLLVIISIVYFKQLHTPTNYLMLSLAVADLLVGIFTLPFTIILFVTSYSSVQGILCTVRSGLDSILCVTSIWTLCFISVDRYYAVCQPLRYRNEITGRVIGIMILASWTVATAIGGTLTFQSPDIGQSSTTCVLFQNKMLKSLLLGTLFGFCIPAIIMTAIYIKILLVAQRQACKILNMSKSGTTVSRSERKATKTLAIVMGVFMICWVPFFISVSCHALSNYSTPSSVVQFFKMLGWTNSMFNPCVYAFFYRHFRLTFGMVIKGKIFKNDFSNMRLC
ncbi:trace amine-associated receptor 4-like [Cynoglossus semilaevis]|uniref:trace amine-associated receptor 4-like n=1 Tax=Cynoglossus semilaevis TaxID=244447 RepID=UPI000D630168|nr:trace amine-associated receptor 4-like [Cynoglossus semilaevis]